MNSVNCQCSCGHTRFSVTGEPLFRVFCHCTICQKFNDAPFSDVLVYATANVREPDSGYVNFETYKPPPNVQRGKCAQCSRPAIEYFTLPLLPKLTIVPAMVHDSNACLPEAKAHIFYDSRVADVLDTLPKHEGFLKSQFAFTRYLLAAKLAN